MLAGARPGRFRCRRGASDLFAQFGDVLTEPIESGMRSGHSRFHFREIGFQFDDLLRVLLLLPLEDVHELVERGDFFVFGLRLGLGGGEFAGEFFQLLVVHRLELLGPFIERLAELLEVGLDLGNFFGDITV